MCRASLLETVTESLRHPGYSTHRSTKIKGHSCEWLFVAICGPNHLVICLNTELEHVGHGIGLLGVDRPAPESLVVLIVFEGLRTHDCRQKDHQRKAHRNDFHLILLMFRVQGREYTIGTDDAVNVDCSAVQLMAIKTSCSPKVSSVSRFK